MTNDFSILLNGSLDRTSTRDNINTEILKIKGQLKFVELTGQLSKSSINSIKSQLDQVTKDYNIKLNIDSKNVSKQGADIGNSFKQALSTSLSSANAEIDKLTQNLMDTFGVKGKKAFTEVRQSIVAYREELKKVSTISNTSFDELDMFDDGDKGVRRVTTALSQNMKVANESKKVYTDLRDIITGLNTGGAKIHLPNSIKQEYGDDFNGMRASLGSAFTTQKGGGDFENFINQLNSQIGTTIDLSKGAENAFGELVRLVKSSKVGNLDVNGMLKEGVLSEDEILNQITKTFDTIEKESIDTTKSILKNEDQKQQAYKDTSESVSNLAKAEQKYGLNSDSLIQSKDVYSGGIGKTQTVVKNFDQEGNVSSGTETIITDFKKIQEETEKATEKLNKFIETRNKLTTSKEITLSGLRAGYDDSNSNKYIKDEPHQKGLVDQYTKIEQAINNVKTADQSKFAQMESNVNKEIAILREKATEYKNAEYVATKLRTKDFTTVKLDETNNLNTFIEKMKQSGNYTSELQGETNKLKSSLENAFDKTELIDYLNSLSNLETKFKSVDMSAKTLSKDTNLKTNVGTELTKLSNLESELKDVGVLTGTLKTKFDTLFSSLSEVSSKSGLTTWRSELKSFESDATSATKKQNLLNAEIREQNKLTSQSEQGSHDYWQGMFKDSVSDITKTNTELAKMADYYNKIENEAKGAEKATAKLKTSSIKLDIDKTKLTDNIEVWATRNGKALKILEPRLNAIKAKIKDADDITLKKLNAEFSSLGKEAVKMGISGDSAFKRLGKNVSNLFSFMSSATIVMGSWRAVKSMIQQVTELDSTLIELQKVSDLSGQALVNFTNKAYELGSTVARTGREVLDATTVFKRAGYTLEQSLDLSKVSLIMMNVGDGISSVDEASSALISTLKGFSLSDTDALKVVDMINSTSNQSPIGFDNITEGLRRVSGTLSQTGASIQETIGLLTGGFARMRDIEMVSSGLIMISQRLRGIGEDGEEIDGLAPKLKKSFKDIANIDIEDSNGNLRDTYAILSDMARIFPTLTSEQQQYLGELASGNRQIKILNSLVQGWSDVESATKNATESQGSALEENEKVLLGINGKINALKSSMEQLSSNTVKSDWIKLFLDLANVLVSASDKIGLFNIALVVLAGLLGGKTSLGLNMFATLIQSLAVKIGITTGATTALSMALSTMIPIALLLIGISVFDKLNVTMEEQKQIVNNLTEAYAKSKEELTLMNSELSTTKSRITELLLKDKLTFLEKDELSKIQASNDELKARIELLKIQQGEQAKIANQSVMDLYKKDTKSDTEYESLYNEIDMDKGLYTGFVDESTHIDELIKKHGELISISGKLSDEQKADLGSIKAELADIGLKYDGYAQDLIVVEGVTEDSIKSQKTEWTGLAKTISQTISPDKWKDTNFTEIFNKAEFKSVKDELTNMAKAGELTAETLNDSKYSDFATALLGIDINATEATNQIMAMNTVVASLPTYGIEELKAKLFDLTIATDEAESQLTELNDVLSRVQNGQSLNAQEITSLITKYDSLSGSLIVTADGYSIEEDALTSLITTRTDGSNLSIAQQFNMTTQLIAQIKLRVNAYSQEIKAIQIARKAQRELELGSPDVQGALGYSGDLGNNTFLRTKQYEGDLVSISNYESSLSELQGKLSNTIANGAKLDKSKGSGSEKTPFQKSIDTSSTAIEKLESRLTSLDAQLADVPSNQYVDRYNIIAQMVDANEEKLEGYQQYLKVFNAKANEELTKIPESIRKLITEGSLDEINITEAQFGGNAEGISEAIASYQSYIDQSEKLQSTISGIDNTISSLKLDILANSNTKFDDSLTSATNDIEDLDNAIKLLNENDTDSQISLLGKQAEISASLVSRYGQEIIKIVSNTDATTLSTAEYISRLRELTLAQAEASISAKGYASSQQDVINKLREVAMESAKVDAENTRDLAIKGIESEIEAIGRAKDARLSGIDAEIKSIEKSNKIRLDSIQSEIDLLNEEKELLQEKQSAYETSVNSVSSLVDKQITAQNELRTTEGKYWDDKISAIDTANDSISKQIALEQAQMALEKANSQKTGKVFRDGEFGWEANQSEVSNAQSSLSELTRENALESARTALESQRDLALSAIDTTILGWENYKQKWEDSINAYEEGINRQTTAQLLGANWEANILNQREFNFDDFATQYAAIRERVDEEIDLEIEKLEEEKVKIDETTQAKIDNLEAQKVAVEESHTAQINSLNTLKDNWAKSLDEIDVKNKEHLEELKTLGETEQAEFDTRLRAVDLFVAQYLAKMALLKEFGGSSGGGGGYSSGNGGYAPTPTQNTNNEATETPSYSGADQSKIDLMKENSQGWANATSQADKNVYVNANNYLGETLGLEKGSDGVWYDEDGKRAYANGTYSARRGLANIDELGNELLIRNPKKGRYSYMEDGDGVVPADKTKNLFKWGEITPNAFMQKMMGQLGNSASNIPFIASTNNNVTNYSIGDIVLQGVQDVDGLTQSIKVNFKNSLTQALSKN